MMLSILFLFAQCESTPDIRTLWVSLDVDWDQPPPAEVFNHYVTQNGKKVYMYPDHYKRTGGMCLLILDETYFIKIYGTFQDNGDGTVYWIIKESYSVSAGPIHGDHVLIDRRIYNPYNGGPREHRYTYKTEKRDGLLYLHGENGTVSAYRQVTSNPELQRDAQGIYSIMCKNGVLFDTPLPDTRPKKKDR